MLAAWVAADVHTARAAASVAPATSEDASCMSGKTGLSVVPRPNRTRSAGQRLAPRRTVTGLPMPSM